MQEPYWRGSKGNAEKLCDLRTPLALAVGVCQGEFVFESKKNFGKLLMNYIRDTQKHFMKKIVFYTIVSDNYYYGVGTHLLVNSFRRFHPDIDLVVYRQDMVDKMFAEKKINFYQAKPSFAKLLYNDYKLVVNIDADTIVTGRLDEVLKDDYDIGGAWNFNDYENASFGDITPEMYIQAGLVGSRSKLFWDKWEEMNKDAMKYVRQENDILNIVVYKDQEISKLKFKFFDKDKDYYGCKSLGREGQFVLDGKKVMCRGEEVKAYHHAKGGVLPKLQFFQMGFQYDVAEYLHHIGHYGQTEKYTKAI